jgi:hypothetical protein
MFSKDGLLALVRDINVKLEKPLDSNQIELVFEQWWPNLEREYFAALKVVDGEAHPPLRDQREMVEEILERLRNVERALFTTPPLPTTLHEYYDQIMAQLTDSQKQVLREIAKANAAGAPLRMPRLATKDRDVLARYLVETGDGMVYLFHRSLVDYLTREGTQTGTG